MGDLKAPRDKFLEGLFEVARTMKEIGANENQGSSQDQGSTYDAAADTIFPNIVDIDPTATQPTVPATLDDTRCDDTPNNSLAAKFKHFFHDQQAEACGIINLVKSSIEMILGPMNGASGDQYKQFLLNLEYVPQTLVQKKIFTQLIAIKTARWKPFKCKYDPPFWQEFK